MHNSVEEPNQDDLFQYSLEDSQNNENIHCINVENPYAIPGIYIKPATPLPEPDHVHLYFNSSLSMESPFSSSEYLLLDPKNNNPSNPGSIGISQIKNELPRNPQAVSTDNATDISLILDHYDKLKSNYDELYKSYLEMRDERDKFMRLKDSLDSLLVTERTRASKFEQDMEFLQKNVTYLHEKLRDLEKIRDDLVGTTNGASLDELATTRAHLRSGFQALLDEQKEFYDMRETFEQEKREFIEEMDGIKKDWFLWLDGQKEDMRLRELTIAENESKLTLEQQNLETQKLHLEEQQRWVESKLRQAETSEHETLFLSQQERSILAEERKQLEDSFQKYNMACEDLTRQKGELLSEWDQLNLTKNTLEKKEFKLEKIEEDLQSLQAYLDEKSRLCEQWERSNEEIRYQLLAQEEQLKQQSFREQGNAALIQELQDSLAKTKEDVIQKEKDAETWELSIEEMHHRNEVLKRSLEMVETALLEESHKRSELQDVIASLNHELSKKDEDIRLKLAEMQQQHDDSMIRISNEYQESSKDRENFLWNQFETLVKARIEVIENGIEMLLKSREDEMQSILLEEMRRFKLERERLEAELERIIYDLRTNEAEYIVLKRRHDALVAEHETAKEQLCEYEKDMHVREDFVEKQQDLKVSIERLSREYTTLQFEYEKTRGDNGALKKSLEKLIRQKSLHEDNIQLYQSDLDIVRNITSNLNGQCIALAGDLTNAKIKILSDVIPAVENTEEMEREWSQKLRVLDLAFQHMDLQRNTLASLIGDGKNDGLPQLITVNSTKKEIDSSPQFLLSPIPNANDSTPKSILRKNPTRDLPSTQLRFDLRRPEDIQEQTVFYEATENIEGFQVINENQHLEEKDNLTSTSFAPDISLNQPTYFSLGDEKAERKIKSNIDFSVEVAHYQNSLDSLRRELDDNENEKRILEDELANLKQLLDNYKVKLAANEDLLARCQRDNEELRQRHSVAISRIGNVENELSTEKEHVVRLKQTQSDLEADIVLIRSKADELIADNNSLLQNVEAQKQRNSYLELELQLAQKKNKELENKSTVNIKEEGVKLDNYSKYNQTLAELTRLKIENQMLQNKLSTVRSGLLDVHKDERDPFNDTLIQISKAEDYLNDGFTFEETTLDQSRLTERASKIERLIRAIDNNSNESFGKGDASFVSFLESIVSRDSKPMSARNWTSETILQALIHELENSRGYSDWVDSLLATLHSKTSATEELSSSLAVANRKLQSLEETNRNLESTVRHLQALFPMKSSENDSHSANAPLYSSENKLIAAEALARKATLKSRYWKVRCRRELCYRSDLIYQKKYLLLNLSSFDWVEFSHPRKEISFSPISEFRKIALTVIAIQKMSILTKKSKSLMSQALQVPQKQFS